MTATIEITPGTARTAWPFPVLPTPRRWCGARAAWLATRAHVDADIQALSTLVLSLDDDGATGDGVADQVRRVIGPALSMLDGSLAAYLTEAEQAGTPMAAAAALVKARAMIGIYRSFVACDATIRLLDANPFRPLSVGRSLTASLTALDAALR